MAGFLSATCLALRLILTGVWIKDLPRLLCKLYERCFRPLQAHLQLRLFKLARVSYDRFEVWVSGIRRAHLRRGSYLRKLSL